MSSPTLTLTRVGSVEGSTPGYGTFGSWNQHVVSNPNDPREVWVAYSRIDENHHRPNYWRLARSDDGGASFAAIYDGEADGSLACPPAIEVDEHGDLFVLASPDTSPDTEDAAMLLYRFSQPDSGWEPDLVRLPIGTPGKFSTVYDRRRGLIHVVQWAWWNPEGDHPSFYSIVPDGSSWRAVQVWRNQEAHPHAAPQYPTIALGPYGGLIVGWSTLDNPLWAAGVQNYYDAHYLASPDGGVTWQGPHGAVTLPIIGDDTGPAYTVNDPGNPVETTPWGSSSYRGNWNLLHSLAIHKSAVHAFYGGPLPARHACYLRSSWSSGVSRRSPFFTTDDGFQFADAGGAFAQAAGGRGSTLFFAGRFHAFGADYIGVAGSDDGGVTWTMRAAAQFAGAVRYVNVARDLAADGSVVGSFTGDPTGRMDGSGDVGVYFFRAAV